MGVTLISRLRRDEVLYEKSGPVRAGWKDRKPVKGKRTPSFKELLEDATQTGWESEIAWYAKGDQCFFSDVMALIRRSIWSEKYFCNTTSKAKTIKLINEECRSLIDLLAGVP
jgi:hypothetical protein